MSRPISFYCSLLFLLLLPGWAPASPSRPVATNDNLVLNGDFLGGLSPWTFEDLSDLGTFTYAHDPATDALGRSDSGALRLDWDLDLTGQFARVGMLQCLGAPPPGSLFHYGYAHRGDRLTSLQVRFYVGEDCTGGGAAFSVQNLDSADWEFFDVVLDLGPDPVDFPSVGVRLRFEELGDPQQAGTSYLDKVFLRQESTVEPLLATGTADTSHGQVVRFTATATGGVSPFEPNYRWDFGDGESSSVQNPVHVYGEAGQYTATLTVETGFEEAVDSLSLDVEPGVGGCVADATTLCIDDQIGDRRFEIQVAYDTELGGGRTGMGQAIPLESLGVSRGGLFWFFNPRNPEMLVKVLNACSLDGNFWVFYSAGTNVGFVVTVRDTLTEALWTHVNPDRHAAPPVQDVDAFECP